MILTTCVYGVCQKSALKFINSVTVGVPAEGSEQVDGGQRARAKSDSKTEVLKLFNRLKVGRYDAATQTKKKTAPSSEEGEGPPSSSHPSSGAVNEGFLEIILNLLRELDVGKHLVDFCSSLPIFKALAEEKGNFLSAPSGRDVTSGLATTVER